MLMVLFSWALIGGAALLFGKAVTDIVYRNRFGEMGRPDVYIVTGLIALTIYGNVQLRTRIILVAQDVKEMVTCLLNNEEVSSNKLVEDLFRDLGDDLGKEEREN